MARMLSSMHGWKMSLNEQGRARTGDSFPRFLWSHMWLLTYGTPFPQMKLMTVYQLRCIFSTRKLDLYLFLH